MIFSMLLNDLISDFIFKGQYQFSLPAILHCVCLQIQVSVETEVFVFFFLLDKLYNIEKSTVLVIESESPQKYQNTYSTVRFKLLSCL